MTQPKYLSREIQYLGDLGAKLRDLQGFRTLAHELIQNADDAESQTTFIKFDVRDNELIVDNDGVFSDCGDVTARECAWLGDADRGYKCDFHRFREIASGDKRGQSGTTGAFGIGFITVYQITDQPEIISSGHHWKLHEEANPEERIELCSGCSKCSGKDLPGTRFIFPWASDPHSLLRKALKAENISPKRIVELYEDLLTALPNAMLFLKQLTKIVLLRDGKKVKQYERVDSDDNDTSLLTDGKASNDRIIYFFRSDFYEEAVKLREKHGDRIEAKRSAEVTIAVDQDLDEDSVLCACLPTERNVGLPFHINADFYTTNDRKSIILSRDYQTEWNRAAIQAAAEAIGDNLEKLAKILGPTGFWTFIKRIRDVAKQNDRETGEHTLTSFSANADEVLRYLPVVYTTAEEWDIPSNTCLLSHKDEAANSAVLEDIGLSVVHEDLRPFQAYLRSEAVGVPMLDIERISERLDSLGLNAPASKRPEVLRDEEKISMLWREIAIILERLKHQPNIKDVAEKRLKSIALAPSSDGMLRQFQEIYNGDPATIDLADAMDLAIPFVKSNPAFRPLQYLCPSFSAESMISSLEEFDIEALEQAWQENIWSPEALFRWLEERKTEILEDEGLKKRLVSLTIFPSSGKMKQFASLSLPGDFKDPLGLADLADLAVLGGRREFLQDLGMAELDFFSYATERLPHALESSKASSEQRKSAALLMAEKLGELKDREGARFYLQEARMIECKGGEFYSAESCYFDADIVRECLGKNANILVLSKGNEAKLNDLYQWLGVKHEPRAEDVVKLIGQISEKAYSESYAGRIRRIISLASHLIIPEDELIDSLRSLAWLPARNKEDRWYAPSEVYTTYRSYLFESQALFLDFTPHKQSSAVELLRQIGVRSNPSTELVVNHLIACASNQVEMNNEVYGFLNEDKHVNDPAVIRLVDKKCLWLDLEKKYYSPHQVFWGEHTFGSYRKRLSENLRSYGNLLNILGVRETPTWEDAVAVIKEISGKFGTENRSLDKETHAVLMSSWRLIGIALNNDSAQIEKIGELHSKKCIPNDDNLLYPPELLFFENRAGLAAKFKRISTNIIQRPIQIGRAWDEAGVRALWIAVQVELLECDPPISEHYLTMGARVMERRNQIGRVLEAQNAEYNTASILEFLEEIKWEKAESIKIRYSLNAFNSELFSEPENVQAIYQTDSKTLVYNVAKRQVAWSVIARELASALLPEEDPGRLASGLINALAPDTIEEAASTLDNLGFAGLDTEIIEPIASEISTDALGSEAIDSEGYTELPAEEEKSAESALEELLGDNIPAPTTPPAMPGSSILPSSGDGRKVGKASKGKGERRVLRSYVATSEEGDLKESIDKSEKDARVAVDIAGVARVIKFESEQGRIAEEMPHENPGYDIESSNKSGKILRYIEVKSISSKWNNTFAVLSKPQFDKAIKEGSLFWLYVVECATSEDEHKIYRIQNPAIQANRFMFDAGWRVTAEQGRNDPE